MRPFALIAALAACNTSVVVGDLEEITALRAVNNPNLDILFVIDNSASMTEQQASLAQNFPRMMDVLEQLDGGLPNIHIGVVTSDMGTLAYANGPGPGIGTIGQGGCTGDGDGGALHLGKFLSDVALADGTRERNYAGSLRDAFGELANVGAIGCGFEQHLLAMSHAFANPANAGFIRPDANLAVVIIADEDDCSALDASVLGPDSAALGPLHSFRCTRFGVECGEDMLQPGVKTNCRPRATSPLIADVKPFVDELLAVKSDPRHIMVAAIAGPPAPVEVAIQAINGINGPMLQPSCTFAGIAGPEYADPAVRLAAFLDEFPGRSQLTSICNADLSGALSKIGSSAKKLLGDPCLDAQNLYDRSPDPGIQPACEVLDIRDSSPAAPTVLPVCGVDSGSDCYDIDADPVVCPSAPENLRVRIRRASAPTADTWTHVRCQLDT